MNTNGGLLSYCHPGNPGTMFGLTEAVYQLRNESGTRQVRDAETADVVVDNFRPGVMARLGVDHETLQQHNPKIITVSITGFGETGPLRPPSVGPARRR